MSYWSHGAIKQMQLGNLKWEHTAFNSRLQPTEIGLGINGTDSSLLKLEYNYGATTNNGNVLTQTVTAPKTAGGFLALTQSYGYDGLNRLQTASENSATNWQQTYDIDRWGNRAVRNTSYLPSPQLTPQSASQTDFSAFNQSTNRLSQTKYPSVLYDAAGNLTRDMVSSTFAYDAENRQITSSVAGVSASYSYDGDGRRVKKVVGSSTTVFVYNILGQLIAEYTSDPVPPPAGGGGTSYLTTDTLGSTRLVTKADGTVKARYDYLPYGEEIVSSIGGRGGVVGYGGADSTKQKFTSKERDVESGLDYFGARYFSSAQGRFTSSDEPFAGQDEDDPQSWNLYAYTSNNPINRHDPDGRRWFYKQEKGKVVDIQWVNANDDGTYTSPGEGYTGFIPRGLNSYLIVLNGEGNLGYVFTEGSDGRPVGFTLAAGGVKDATMGLVADYLVGKGIGKLLEGAFGAWKAWRIAKAAEEAMEAAAKDAAKIVAKDGTEITGLTKHGVNRVIGDMGKRAGTKPEAILDALKNPIKIKEGVDKLGRPYKVYQGANARVVVNPQTGKIVSTNPLSGAGAN